jgi:hypothetical protein
MRWSGYVAYVGVFGNACTNLVSKLERKRLFLGDLIVDGRII